MKNILCSESNPFTLHSLLVAYSVLFAFAQRNFTNNDCTWGTTLTHFRWVVFVYRYLDSGSCCARHILSVAVRIPQVATSQLTSHPATPKSRHENAENLLQNISKTRIPKCRQVFSETRLQCLECFFNRRVYCELYFAQFPILHGSGSGARHNTN